MTGYTTADVAEILSIPPPRVRSLARAGLLEPGRNPQRHYRFSFQDIVVLRVIRDCYLRSEEATPGHAMARYNQGVVLEDLGRPDEAVNAHLRALEVDPDLGAAHFNLSRLYEAAGDTAGAVRHLSAYRRVR